MMSQIILTCNLSLETLIAFLAKAVLPIAHSVLYSEYISNRGMIYFGMTQTIPQYSDYIHNDEGTCHAV